VPGLAITGTSIPIVGPTAVSAFLGCASGSKIAISGSVYDTTSNSNTTFHGAGNNGVINGAAAGGTWDMTFALGATSGSGDTLDFQILCVNPPVSNAAPINPSAPSSKPTVKIVTHPLR
jgi:hypothetical protein